MIAFYIILVAVLIILAVTLYFFAIAFVRRNGGAQMGFESAESKFLAPHKNEIIKGIEYIKSLDGEECTVTSFDGLRLYGEFYKRDNARGTAIIFHGYRSDARRDFCCAVKMYGDLGLNVLLVDQRSHGKSEGRLITFGVKERYDVLEWVKFVIETQGENEPILLGGMSMGATTVLLSSALNLPSNVKGIVADSGFTSPIDIIKKVGREKFNIDATIVMPIFDLYCRIFGGFKIRGISAVNAVKNTKIPILYFHGLRDNFVPCEMCRENYDATASVKEIHLIEGADHGLGYFFDTEGVEGAVKRFIDRNFN